MEVKIKKLHPDAVIPSYSKDGDAGMDLTAINTIAQEDVTEYGTVNYKFGLAIEIPKGYVGLIFPRSSIYKSTTRLANAVGVIDSGYRGEISVQMDVAPPAMMDGSGALGYKGEMYEKCDRVAQLIIMPYPQIEFQEVDDLSETERGTGGYGSTNTDGQWVYNPRNRHVRKSTPDREQIINKIVNIHPSAGVDMKLSEYVGGMTDTGKWYVGLLHTLELKELVMLYEIFKKM